MKTSDMFPDRDSHKPKIQQPVALSAGTWTGRILAVHEQHAPKGKKWIKYTVEAEGGVAFTSFSSTDKLLATCAMEADEPIEVQWERDGYGGKKILLMQPVDEVDTLFDAEVETSIRKLKGDMKP